MAIIKTVTNGDRSVTFRAVSLGHVVAIVFGFVSLLGAQQTWLWSAANERAVIVSQMKDDLDRQYRLNNQIDAAAFAEVNRRLSSLESQMNNAERQININTGRIERMR